MIKYFTNKKRVFPLLIFIVIGFGFIECSEAVRIKDITTIKGVRKNQLFGYGLVIGLNGTGDTATNVPFVSQSIVSMLARMNITIPPNRIKDLKSKNIATVIVAADLLPFAKTGNKLDVVISSIGDAKSLKGGFLLFTPLKGADGQIYAIAQGTISVGDSGNKKRGKSHLTVGRVASGATIEKEIPYNFKNKNTLVFSLLKPDFTTAFRVAEAINSRVLGDVARPVDAGNIKVNIPIRYKSRKVEFVTKIEDIFVTPDVNAKVVIDERTGTVVVGKNVRISTVAISHGNLSVEIKAKVGATTTQTAPAAAVRRAPRRRRRGQEKKGNRLMILPESVNIRDLVGALNAIGVKSENLIVIFQSLKAAGALQAELEII